MPRSTTFEVRAHRRPVKTCFEAAIQRGASGYSRQAHRPELLGEFFIGPAARSVGMQGELCAGFTHSFPVRSPLTPLTAKPRDIR